jgi:hypothetical protein
MAADPVYRRKPPHAARAPSPYKPPSRLPITPTGQAAGALGALALMKTGRKSLTCMEAPDR